jgi:hypothetical protein
MTKEEESKLLEKKLQLERRVNHFKSIIFETKKGLKEQLDA